MGDGPPFTHPGNNFPQPLSFPAVNFSTNHDGGDDHSHQYAQHQNTYDLNSKIMLTAIISLSFVVVLVIILHIYARCVLRRRARTSAIIRRFAAQNHSGEPPKNGLDPAIIASLPIFVYKKETVSQEEEEEDEGSSSIECAVCLCFLEDQEMARVLPNCKHTFHAECIDKWLSSHSTCPICRTEAEPRIQPVHREGLATAGVAPTAPPLGRVFSVEGISENGNNQASSSNKQQVGGSSSFSRLSSFRRILSRERSSRRLQSEIQEDGIQDLERQ